MGAMTQRTITHGEHEVHEVREDEHDINFDDNRDFAAKKWSTTVEAQEISAGDWARSRNVGNYEEFGDWIRASIRDSRTPQQESHLRSLLLLARPMLGFINAFEKLIAPEKVDMNILWVLSYINISLALPHNEKLKRITPWLGALRRNLDQLTQCVENARDDNSTRSEITDVFEPILQILTGLIKFQRTYVMETQFAKAYVTIKEHIDLNTAQIEDVVYHFRQISMHSKANIDQSSSRVAFRGVPFRSVENPYDRAAFPVDNLPKIRTEIFFGREANIERVDKFLGNQTVQQLRTYLIYGQRGVGKTQIALEYARLYRSKFDAVFWIRCETSASLRQSFSEIAVKLELAQQDQLSRFEENQIKVLEWLTKTNKTWLLIYDNAEREQKLASYWPREAVGSVLLTSRSYFNFEHKERREGETIPVFDEDERWELLMKLLGDEWQHKHLGGHKGNIEREAARNLLRRLGGLALAIAQAAAMVKDNRLTGDQSIATLYKIFEEHSLRLPPRLSGGRDHKIHALDAIWSIALNVLTTNARSLLGVFCLLSPDAMPVDIFLPRNQARLDKTNLAFCKQPVTNIAAWEISPDMEAAVDELTKAGLIRKDGRNFVIHRVIQEAMNYVNIEELQQSFDAATELLHEAFPLQLKSQPLHDEWPRCQFYIQHVVHLTKMYSSYQRGNNGNVVPDLNFIRLLSNAGWYLYEVADYAECIDMMNIACSACDDKSSLLYSHLLNALGSSYVEVNKLKKGRAVFDEALKIRVRKLDEDDLQLASTYANIGNIDTSQGNFDEAQESFEKAARIRQARGEEQDLNVGLAFLQLGRNWFLRSRDETYHAIKMYDKAETCFMRSAGKSQPYMAHLYYARGNLELERGELMTANMQYEKCRDVCLNLWPVHPLTCAVYYKIGCVYIARGRKFHENALLNLEKAFNIAMIRSSNEVDGTTARIQWKQAEVMIDDPIRRPDGLKLREGMKTVLPDIAAELELAVDPEWEDDEAFDQLVPGFFR